MNRILLALTILSAGAGGFLTARQSTSQLQHEAQAAGEAWLAQTQLVATAQSEQTGLMEHVREWKQALAQPPAVDGRALWSVLQTNRADLLPPELRERLREELGFNWQASAEFVFVSKDAVRQVQMWAITQDGKLTDSAAAVLALTPGERGQVEAAMLRGQTDFRDWALPLTERIEPKDDVVAHYTLPGSPAALSQSISNNFATAVFDALGKERAELMLASAWKWMESVGLGRHPATLIVEHYLAGSEQRLRVRERFARGGSVSYDLPKRHFPPAFRPLFPNGWADVAKREGFELPPEPQKK